jgi:hypothetical protein
MGHYLIFMPIFADKIQKIKTDGGLILNWHADGAGKL